MEVLCKSHYSNSHLKMGQNPITLLSIMGRVLLEEDPKYWSLRRRRRHITSESEDADWEPEMEPEKPVRRGGRGTARPEVARRERRVQHTPVPQKRKTGTKKITQWIMSLLRDPQYNPR